MRHRQNEVRELTPLLGSRLGWSLQLAPVHLVSLVSGDFFLLATRIRCATRHSVLVHPSDDEGFSLIEDVEFAICPC